MALEGRHEFGPNNGRLVGVLGIVVAAVVVVSVVSDGLQAVDAAVLSFCALVVLFLWCLFLRPKIVVDGPVLHLRNAFSDVRIPLVQVDYIAVTMFTNVVTVDRSWRSTALTRSRREHLKKSQSESDPMNNLSDLAESKINQLIDDAKAQRLPEGTVVARPAVVELTLLAGLAVLGVVLLFVVG